MNMSDCAEGTSGSGTLITVCNNGDLAEWFVEDNGQKIGTVTLQMPPTTPDFGTIAAGLSPTAMWANGDGRSPSNSTCSMEDEGCTFSYTEYHLSSTGQAATGNNSTLTVVPSWSAYKGALVFPYAGPPPPGFDWPDF